MNSAIQEHVYLPPSWLDALVDIVAATVKPQSVMGHLNCGWACPRDDKGIDYWFVCVYPTSNEIFGGENDGRKLVPVFDLDLLPILKNFSSLKKVYLAQPARYNAELDGPGLTIMGTFLGNEVLLKIFQLPSEHEEASLMVDQTSGTVWTKSTEADPPE